MSGRELTKTWPTTLESATDLAGFLRRKMKQAGGEIRAFKTAERFLKDILSDWGDAYEIALVYDRVIDTYGATDQIWNLLDLRAYTRFRRQYAPVQGTAYYVYQATFATSGAQRAQMLDLVEELEDAIAAQDTAEQKRLRGLLDVQHRGLRSKS